MTLINVTFVEHNENLKHENKKTFFSSSAPFVIFTIRNWMRSYNASSSFS